MIKKRKQKNRPENSVSSGNVSADFGFPNPEESQAKADLARMITRIIKERKLSQQKAAEIIGIDQPKISKITRGLLSEFTVERLMRFLLNLGFDIELKLKRHSEETTMPAIHVAISQEIQSE